MKIPFDAWQPMPGMPFELLGEIEEWYCPDCGAGGQDFHTLDFINNSLRLFENREASPTDSITLCCSECFKENIYIRSKRE